MSKQNIGKTTHYNTPPRIEFRKQEDDLLEEEFLSAPEGIGEEDRVGLYSVESNHAREGAQ